MSEPLIQFNNVETFYGPVQALKGVSFKLNKGEILTIIGANGAGKSTILKTLSGALKAKKGDYFCQGQSLRSLQADEISKLGIGHVPEGREVFPLMTVKDNLRLGAFHRQQYQDSLDRVLDYFPILKDKYKTSAGLLSGGQQQMLALGRALMQDPHTLLLDEPSLGLAPALIKELFQVLLDLNQKLQLSMILVEQNARAALAYAHRGYVLELGRIVLEGRCDELSENDDVKEFYLGGRDDGIRGRRRWKKRKSW